MGKKIIITLIHWYQKTLSPDHGVFRVLYPRWTRCTMYPSCSQYMILAIERYGLLKGIIKGVRRVFRCHPYQKQRVDFP